MFVESNGWILSAGDIASRFGGIRGRSRILQISENFKYKNRQAKMKENLNGIK